MLAPTVVLLAILTVAMWVYRDAREHRDSGRPVAITIGSLTIDTPEAWLTGCLVFSIVFIPIYLVARQGT